MSRVLVGVTDGATGGRVLAWGMREAVATGAQLVVVRAATRLPEAVLAAVARGNLPALEQVDAGLARAIAAARHMIGSERVSVVVDRAPAGQVLTGLARVDDLLVVGAPSQAGWWGRGSTTYHVITKAFCPIVVVRAPEPVDGGDSGVPEGLRSHVVVGVDGSAPQDAALDYGFAYARTHGLPVLVAAYGQAALPAPVAAGTGMVAQVNGTATARPALSGRYPDVPTRETTLAGDPVQGLRLASVRADLLVLTNPCRPILERPGCPVAVVQYS